jgi:hypothetical protein
MTGRRHDIQFPPHEFGSNSCREVVTRGRRIQFPPARIHQFTLGGRIHSFPGANSPIHVGRAEVVTTFFPQRKLTNSRWEVGGRYEMSSRCPFFFTIRDGMQGMELAPRTPLTDAARNALVSSWRRLSRRVRTLRPAATGLTGVARRQDQVLVDEGRYEMLSRRRRVTQFPHRESNDPHWEVGLQKFPLMLHGRTS